MTKFYALFAMLLLISSITAINNDNSTKRLKGFSKVAKAYNTNLSRYFELKNEGLLKGTQGLLIKKEMLGETAVMRSMLKAIRAKQVDDEISL